MAQFYQDMQAQIVLKISLGNLIFSKLCVYIQRGNLNLHNFPFLDIKVIVKPESFRLIATEAFSVI